MNSTVAGSLVARLSTQHVPRRHTSRHRFSFHLSRLQIPSIISRLAREALYYQIQVRRQLSTQPKLCGHATNGHRTECWNCRNHGVDIYSSGGLFCDQCGAVQPPCAACDFFSFFQCPRDFCIDESALSQRYKQLQMKLHPDRNVKMTSEQARVFSASQSALINDAYKTLKDPYRRAAYLLSTFGVDIESEAGSKYANSDPELLMEVMETREQIEAAESISEVAKIVRKTKDDILAAVTVLSDAFQAHDLHKAVATAIKLKYLTKIKEEAESRIEAIRAAHDAVSDKM